VVVCSVVLFVCVCDLDLVHMGGQPVCATALYAHTVQLRRALLGVEGKCRTVPVVPLFL